MSTMLTDNVSPKTHTCWIKQRPVGVVAFDRSAAKWHFLAYAPLPIEPRDALFDTEDEAKAAFEDWADRHD